jgi:hypothetical protein
MSSIALSSAQRHVELFNNGSAHLTGNGAAAGPPDWEDLIQLGIEAFRWIERADARWRDSIRTSAASFSQHDEQSITSLYDAWLQSYADLESKIARHANDELAPENLTELRDCCEQVQEVLETRAWVNRSRVARTSAEQSDD